MELKKCSRCHAKKSVEEFPRHKGMVGGRHPHCKVCKSRSPDKKYALGIPKKQNKIDERDEWADDDDGRVFLPPEFTPHEVKNLNPGPALVDVSQLTPEALKNIVGALEDGHSKKAAFGISGLNPNTGNTWLSIGRQEGASEALRHFSETVDRASAVGCYTISASLIASARADPRAAKWLLERLHYEDFAARAPIEKNEDNRIDPEALRESLSRKLDSLFAEQNALEAQAGSAIEAIQTEIPAGTDTPTA